VDQASDEEVDVEAKRAVARVVLGLPIGEEVDEQGAETFILESLGHLPIARASPSATAPVGEGDDSACARGHAQLGADIALRNRDSLHGGHKGTVAPSAAVLKLGLGHERAAKVSRA
jgi:hypothetical protein